MTVEAYYDGEAVRPLEPIKLKKDQRVFISVPFDEVEETEEERKERIAEQRKAIRDLGTLLTKEELKKFEETLRPAARL